LTVMKTKIPENRWDQEEICGLSQQTCYSCDTSHSYCRFNFL